MINRHFSSPINNTCMKPHQRSYGILSFGMPFILLCFLISGTGCQKMAQPNTGNGVADKAHRDKPKGLDLKLIADNFVSPIALVQPPDEEDRLFVVDQVGKIWIIDA